MATLRNIAFIFFCFCFTTICSQVPGYIWAQNPGGISSDEGKCVCVDPSGNIIVAGSFSSPSITFGTITLTNSGGINVFIVKYDASGNALWARNEGGAGEDRATAVAADINGNVYVTGYYFGPTATFGTAVITNADNGGANSDVYLAKYSPAGALLWVRSAGGLSGADAPYSDQAHALALDSSGNPIISGFFNSPVIVFNTTNLNNFGGSGNSDIFLVKYSASGSVLWGKNEGGSLNDVTWGLAVDNSNNIITTGWYSSSAVAWGSDTLTNADGFGMYDFFLVKHDPLGNVIWAKRAGQYSDDKGSSVSTDAAENIYVTGHFQSPSISFGLDTLTRIGSNGFFLVKYAPTGNEIWAKGSTGASDAIGYSLFSDSAGNVLVAGNYFSPYTCFETDTLTNTNSSGLNSDLFLIQYNSSGALLWSKTAGGSVDDFATGICADVLGNIYIGGYFNSPSITFGATVLNLISSGYPDIFVVRLGSTVGIPEIFSGSNSGLSLYPNPAGNTLTLTSSSDFDNASFLILDVKGNVVIQTKSTSKNLFTIDISALASGIYLLEAYSSKAVLRKKFIKN